MKLIILGRDGVINERSDAPIRSPEQWHALPGSLEAIARLAHAGYHVVVATHQPRPKRRAGNLEDLHRVHEHMHQKIHDCGGAIEAIFFCSDPDPGNPWHKPNPGMYEAIAQRLRVPLGGVTVIGDQLADIQAARAAGAHPVLVLTGRGQTTLDAGEGLDDVPVYPDLGSAVDALTSQTKSSS